MVITLKKNILATRVSTYVNTTVRKVVRGLGISVSEYLRTLILHDLESKGMFKEELKHTLEQPEEQEITPEDSIRELLRGSWDE